MAQESTKLLQLTDKNNDGVVDFDEFTTWFEGVFSSLCLCHVVHAARLDSSLNTPSRFELELRKLKERASNAEAIIQAMGEETDSASQSLAESQSNSESRTASVVDETETSLYHSDTAERIYSELDRIETIILKGQTDTSLVKSYCISHSNMIYV